MKHALRRLLLAGTHTVMLCIGVALGIYLLPILTAPDSPDEAMLNAAADTARFTGTFHRELEDSDFLHWGEGTLFVGGTTVAMQGSLAPGPDYRLYLSPEFAETEAGFAQLKSQMAHVGHIRTFDGFMIDIPADIDPSRYTTAIVWCESFGQFITAAQYR